MIDRLLNFVAGGGNRIAVYRPVGCRVIDRLLNFVAGGGGDRGVSMQILSQRSSQRQLDLDLTPNASVPCGAMAGVHDLVPTALSLSRGLSHGTTAIGTRGVIGLGL